MEFDWLNKTGKSYVLGHRGVKMLYPENTLLSFKKAIELDCDIVELDIHLSKDNEIIVIHDETVDRTTNGNGWVKEMTSDELKELDAGSWFDAKYSGHTECRIPFLFEVLELLKETEIGLNIEIKNGPVFYEMIGEKTLKLIDKYNMNGQVLISSFDHNVLKHIKELNNEIKTAALYCSYLNNPVSYFRTIKVDGAHPYWHYVTEDLIRNLHSEEMFINTWIINDQKTFEKVNSWNIDAVGTDNPKLLI